MSQPPRGPGEPPRRGRTSAGDSGISKKPGGGHTARLLGGGGGPGQSPARRGGGLRGPRDGGRDGGRIRGRPRGREGARGARGGGSEREGGSRGRLSHARGAGRTWVAGEGAAVILSAAAAARVGHLPGPLHVQQFRGILDLHPAAGSAAVAAVAAAAVAAAAVAPSAAPDTAAAAYKGASFLTAVKREFRDHLYRSCAHPSAPAPVAATFICFTAPRREQFDWQRELYIGTASPVCVSTMGAPPADERLSGRRQQLSVSAAVFRKPRKPVSSISAAVFREPRKPVSSVSAAVFREPRKPASSVSAAVFREPWKPVSSVAAPPVRISTMDAPPAGKRLRGRRQRPATHAAIFREPGKLIPTATAGRLGGRRE